MIRKLCNARCKKNSYLGFLNMQFNKTIDLKNKKLIVLGSDTLAQAVICTIFYS